MKNKIVMNLQLFAGSKTGVYPCYENQFQVDTASGGTATIFGVKRKIQEARKARNPDGTVNYTEVLLI